MHCQTSYQEMLKNTFAWTHITMIQISLNKGYDIASIRVYMTANLISVKLITSVCNANVFISFKENKCMT